MLLQMALFHSFLELSNIPFYVGMCVCLYTHMHIYIHIYMGFPGGSMIIKEPSYQCSRDGFDPWMGKVPWRRKWQSIPVFLPGESHGQRSLVSYSPWGHKESDMTEWLKWQQKYTHTHTRRYSFICQWTLRLLPCPNSCKYCWCVDTGVWVSFQISFLQKWHCRITWGDLF